MHVMINEENGYQNELKASTTSHSFVSQQSLSALAEVLSTSRLKERPVQICSARKKCHWTT
jgi:hypothetical protein